MAYKTFFHGTSEDNAEMICSGDWQGSEFTEMTDGFSSMKGNGVVFMTDDRAEAEGYGDSVISVEIDEDDAKFFQEAGHSSAKEFYVDVNRLNESGVWWLE